MKRASLSGGAIAAASALALGTLAALGAFGTTAAGAGENWSMASAWPELVLVNIRATLSIESSSYTSHSGICD